MSLSSCFGFWRPVLGVELTRAGHMATPRKVRLVGPWAVAGKVVWWAGLGGQREVRSAIGGKRTDGEMEIGRRG